MPIEGSHLRLSFTTFARTLLILVPISCNGAPSGGSTTGDDDAEAEAGQDATGTSGSGQTTTMPPATCESTEDCGDQELFCVAAWDPGTAQKGEAACVASCVEANAIDRWCIDDAACCENLRCNEVDGFCLPLPGGTTTGTTSDTTDTDTDMDSGTTSTTSPTTGTDTSSGTTTDATTGSTTTTG